MILTAVIAVGCVAIGAIAIYGGIGCLVFGIATIAGILTVKKKKS